MDRPTKPTDGQTYKTDRRIVRQKMADRQTYGETKRKEEKTLSMQIDK